MRSAVDWSSILALPSWSVVAAVVIAALAGSLHAARRGFDLVGVVGLAIATGLGGILMRDVLLQTGTPLVLLDDSFLLGAVAAGLVGFSFGSVLMRARALLFVLDAFAMGMLVSLGTDYSLRQGAPTGSALFLGVLTGVGGLVLRDVLSGDAPQIMRPGLFITVAALAGSVAYVLLSRYTPLPGSVVQLLTVAVVVAVRGLSRVLHWETRPPVDYTPVLRRLTRRLGRSG